MAKCTRTIRFKFKLLLAVVAIYVLSFWTTGLSNFEWPKSVYMYIQSGDIPTETKPSLQSEVIATSLQSQVKVTSLRSKGKATELHLFPFLSWHAKTSSKPTSRPPQQNIVFFKTHKTGGSAIQNLCLRYAVTHDLLIALPRQHNYFGHPWPFEKSMVAQPLNGRKYHVFAHHTRFNYENIKDLMPDDSVFFTILREPASLFESSFAYYNFRAIFKMSLEDLVSHNKSHIDLLNQRLGHGKIGRNQMTFDLGAEIAQFENKEEIRKLAETLNDQFQLVMIQERMNESLVLLKHLLSWTTDDVVVLHLNARRDKVKKKLTPELKDKILFWNQADSFLYEYFSKKFDDKVKAFGEDRMREEVQELRTRIDQWYKYCAYKMNHKASRIAANIEGFQLSKVHNETCEYLVKDELVFTSELVAKQSNLVSRRR